MIIEVANGMNAGRGLRMLTDEGAAQRTKLVRAEKRKRGIHHAQDYTNEDWYLALERQLFAAENEGTLWTYAKIVRR